jgi:hypothetical protein
MQFAGQKRDRQVELPRVNVEYWLVQVTAPQAVSAQELEDAMRNEEGPGAVVNLAMDAFQPWEVNEL